MKTWGQRLYEHEHPAFVKVVLYSDHFRTNPFMVSNPSDPIPWRFLTAASKATWERSAIGHNMFTAAEQAQQRPDELLP